MPTPLSPSLLAISYFAVRLCTSSIHTCCVLFLCTTLNQGEASAAFHRLPVVDSLSSASALAKSTCEPAASEHGAPWKGTWAMGQRSALGSVPSSHVYT